MYIYISVCEHVCVLDPSTNIYHTTPTDTTQYTIKHPRHHRSQTTQHHTPRHMPHTLQYATLHKQHTPHDIPLQTSPHAHNQLHST